MAVRVGHRSAPEIVGGHAGQRAGAQNVGVHGHGRYVVVHEIAAEAVPVTRGDGRGHAHVHGHRDLGPPPALLAATPDTAAPVMRLLVIAAAVVVVMVMVVLRPSHRGHRATTCAITTGRNNYGTVSPDRKRFPKIGSL